MHIYGTQINEQQKQNFGRTYNKKSVKKGLNADDLFIYLQLQERIKHK